MPDCVRRGNNNAAGAGSIEARIARRRARFEPEFGNQ